jgi:hypothetical protein
MGSLSNLYISQSFISLLHLGSDNTASSTLTAIQDGLGNSIGVSVNTAGDVALAGTLSIKRGLDITGSVKINTAVTASTQQFVNSGNQFTDNIIRITGSYDSGSTENPGVYQIQNGWKCYGPGLGDSGATVIANDYVPATGWRFTIDKNTAVWFGLYNFTDPNVQYYNFAVSGSEDITGSLWIRDRLSVTDISASNSISASNLYVKGRISAYELDVTIESSSIIFTSGSNILGDEANVDTQTLIGRVIVSGSLEVTSSIKATSDISSSTLNGIGNVSLYSASVSQRIETNSSSFYNFSSSQYLNDSSSFDSRMDAQEAFSSSLVATFATVLQLNTSSSVLQSNINTKLDTASFNSYSASVASNTSILSGSTYQTDVTQSNRITILEGKSSTTGSNTFVGNQIITGSLRGNVTTLSVISQTASMDCNLGNFFTLTLPTASTTTINASNIQPGETVQLRVQQQSVTGSLTLGTGFVLSTGSVYEASNVANKSDILSFISFDTSSLYTVFVRTF